MNIKNRILLCVLVLQIAGFTALLVHYNNRATQAVFRFNSIQILNTLSATASQMNASAEQLERTALGLARSGEHFHEKHHRINEAQLKAELQRLMLRTFTGFGDARAAGLWYEPHTLIHDQSHFSAYLDNPDGQPLFSLPQYDASFDYLTSRWYQQVIPDGWPRSERPAQPVYWSLQGAEEFPGHEDVMTVAAPMFDDDHNLIGVATVNRSLSAITRALAHLSFTPGTRVSLYYEPQQRFLTDSHGLSADQLQPLSGLSAATLRGRAQSHLFAVRMTPGLILAVQIPQQDLDAVVAGTLSDGLAIHAGIAVLFLAIMATVLGVLFRPFEQILGRLRTVVRMNRSNDRLHFVPIHYDAQNEFTPIVDTYNTLVGQITDFTDRLSHTNALLQAEQQRVAELNATLESKVEDRTRELEDKNREVVESLQLLKLTQKQLLNLEKHSALGEVVAGLAHEINTPLGITVTAVSALEDQLADLESRFRNNSLNKDAFNDYLELAREGTSIAADNLRRAADLIARFKQVAVDQASEQKRDFELCDYVQSILFSLRPSYKYRPLDVNVIASQRIIVSGYPGAVAQIITNLLMNALTHAFPPEQDDPAHRGQIDIVISEDNEQVRLVFRDNGAGMSEDIRSKLFSPFFTTRRAQGGSGLGTSIILDLVTHQLNGSISVTSTPGEGTEFVLRFPPRQAAAA
ncbi:ATP-binding protein [Thalassolituus sp. LLYu03]|uniref:ATP-binding protein n=1 Tax=Thalassolituus sp. LLYu03 TaxID=3421656 RepID=UPI003D2BFC71